MKEIKATGLESGEINVLKGLLIFLIVVGHNKVFTSLTGSFEYLYSFHVVCFFILSALLNEDKINDKKVITKAVTYWYPYTVFFFFLTLASYFTKNSAFLDNGGSWADFMYSYISADIGKLRPYTGFVYIWFLPALTFFYLLMALSNSIGLIYRALFLVCLLSISFAMEVIGGGQRVSLPFAFQIVIFVVPISLFIKYVLIARMINPYWTIVAFGVLAFLSNDYYQGGVNIPSSILPLGSFTIYLKYLLFICSVYLLLHQLAKALKKSKLLSYVGLYSLEIYLVHNLINYIIVDFLCSGCRAALSFYQDWLFAIGVFIATLLLSLAFAVLSKKNALLGLLFRYK
jgi:fucose 4-O-acetylase-like acetyltransferase